MVSASLAVQWWDQWQLRVLVLGSLCIQYLLFVAAAFRKYCTRAWFRSLIWLAYLGSDAITVYALAILFSLHKKVEWATAHPGSIGLDVLWSAILLLHLGGRDDIVAYSLEDNQLWKRHLLTAVSQVTVAVYVFSKSWSGINRLSVATILIFIPGILKCLEKSWALKRASIHGTSSESSALVEIPLEGKRDPYYDFLTRAVPYFISPNEQSMPTTDNVQEAQDNEADYRNDKPYDLFMDRSYTNDVRLQKLRHMVHNKDKVHNRLSYGLSNTFHRLYTKSEMYNTHGGKALRIMTVCMMLAAIILFHKSHREGYNDTDIKITYTLLCCTVIIEGISFGLPLLSFDICLLFTGLPWSDHVAQYSVIGHLSRSRQHSWLASCLSLKDCFDQLWCMEPPCKRSSDITMLVHDYVTCGWKEITNEVGSYYTTIQRYNSFNDQRGMWTIKRMGAHLCDGYRKTVIFESLQRPFDESVVLWHLATDLCFYESNDEYDIRDVIRRRCRKLSNYMAYLLFAKPEMLMPGARRSLLKHAREKFSPLLNKIQEDDSDNLELNGGKARATLPVEEVASKIVAQATVEVSNLTFISDVWYLYQDLVRFCKSNGKLEMWRLIEGVWVEKICFAAGRCRGYLHAKSLGEGGEYLSYIWLLLLYMGMETVEQKLRRTDNEGEGMISPLFYVPPAPPFEP